MYPEEIPTEAESSPAQMVKDWFDVEPRELSLTYLANMVVGAIASIAVVYIIALDNKLAGALVGFGLIAAGYALSHFVDSPDFVPPIADGIMLGGALNLLLQAQWGSTSLSATESSNTNAIIVSFLLTFVGLALFGAPKTKGISLWLVVSLLAIHFLLTDGFSFVSDYEGRLAYSLSALALTAVAYAANKADLKLVARTTLAFAAVLQLAYSALFRSGLSGDGEILLLILQVLAAAVILYVAISFDTYIIAAIATVSIVFTIYDSPHMRFDGDAARINGLVILGLGVLAFAAANYKLIMDWAGTPRESGLEAYTPSGIQQFDPAYNPKKEQPEQQWDTENSTQEFTRSNTDNTPAVGAGQRLFDSEQASASSGLTSQQNDQIEDSSDQQPVEETIMQQQTSPGDQEVEPPATQPNWYPDPEGRYEFRWHDGRGWTKYVSVGGEQMEDS